MIRLQCFIQALECASGYYKFVLDLVAAADAAWTIEEAGLLGRLGLGDDDGKATRVRSASPWWRSYAWAFEDCSEVLNLDAASSMRTS